MKTRVRGPISDFSGLHCRGKSKKKRKKKGKELVVVVDPSSYQPDKNNSDDGFERKIVLEKRKKGKEWELGDRIKPILISGHNLSKNAGVFCTRPIVSR